MDRPAAARGRPRNTDRRARIVRAALDLFADNGYAGCTMREVANACGMGETLLYRYYPRKAELLEAVAEQAEERLTTVRETMSAAAARATELRELLLGSGRIYLYHAESYSAWYALWAQRPPISAERQARLCDAEHSIVADAADGLRRFAQWRDPYAGARAFVSAVLGHVMLQDRMVCRPESVAARTLFLEELTELVVASALRPPERHAARVPPRRRPPA